MPEEPWYADGLQFTCTQCGNCCTGPPGYVWFTEEEAGAISEYLQIDIKTFYRRYTHKIHNRRSLNEEKTPQGHDCVFLSRTENGKALCSIYPVRPVQCRTWPFWPENLASSAAWRRAAKTCPGINHGDYYPVEKIRIIRDRNVSEEPVSG